MSCDNTKIVAVPGFGFFSECINNDINNQFQVSQDILQCVSRNYLTHNLHIISATSGRSEYHDATRATRL